MPERRQHPRVPCALNVTVEGLDEPVRLTTRDVSLGGVFLYSQAPRLLFAEVELTLHAPQHHLRARGRVVHHVPDVGFGVQFLSLLPGDDTRLAEFLAQVEESAAR